MPAACSSSPRLATAVALAVRSAGFAHGLAPASPIGIARPGPRHMPRSRPRRRRHPGCGAPRASGRPPQPPRPARRPLDRLPSLAPMAERFGHRAGAFPRRRLGVAPGGAEVRHPPARRSGRGPRPRPPGRPPADAPAPLRQQAAAGLRHSHRRRDPHRSHRSRRRSIGWPGCVARPIRKAPRPLFAKCSNNWGPDRRSAMSELLVRPSSRSGAAASVAQPGPSPRSPCWPMPPWPWPA